MALISNGTTVVSSGTVSYNRLTDTPTIPTNTNQLTNGAGFLTSAPAPTTAQVASATAGISAGGVGSYGAFLRFVNRTDTFGSTESGSNLVPVSFGGSNNGVDTPSGTWRLMGYRNYNTNSNSAQSSVYLRIS